MSKIDNAVSFAENVARDDSHGYDQIHRWGDPDYDCSGLVITACEKAGIPLKTNGATYTGNIYQSALKSGFKDVTNSVNLSTGAGLKRGDILLKPNGHVAFYCGNGKMVDARINENGKITGGKKGDQTGKEIMIHAYRNHPFKYVLRYPGGSSSASKPASTSTPASHFKVGSVYTTQVSDLNVRTGPGTSYHKKSRSELTADGRKHADAEGQLKKGTRVTCKAVKKVGSNVWIQTPSGWLCAYNGSKYYVK